MTERTLSIIKPDAVAGDHIGEILSRFEESNLKIIAMKMIHLSKTEAGAFYKEHAERPFYDELKKFIASGPIVVSVLEGENAIAVNRELMGATNPQEAAPGTIRHDFAKTVDANAVHGSDSLESAEREIRFFFGEIEIDLD